jgi:hypothetical protein
MGTWPDAFAELLDVVVEPGEPLLELLPELQAAMSVAAAAAASATVVAREGPLSPREPTPRRLRNLMGTS